MISIQADFAKKVPVVESRSAGTENWNLELTIKIFQSNSQEQFFKIPFLVLLLVFFLHRCDGMLTMAFFTGQKDSNKPGANLVHDRKSFPLLVK